MSVVVVAVVAMAALLAATVLAAGDVALAASRARGVADAAALAAAYSARDSRALGQSEAVVLESACGRAAEVAQRWQATVTRCEVAGGAVLVGIRVRAVFGGVGAASRAGPR